MVCGLPSAAALAHFLQKLNRLKPLEESSMETSLRPCLSTLDLTLLGVHNMVGSGLYVITGIVAKDIAGPAVVLSYCVAAVASLLAALCYAEFGARVPRTGSAYQYTYRTMGELWAFLIGWNIILESVIAGAVNAQGLSGYMDVNHRIRNFIVTHVGSWQVPMLGYYPDFLAAGILLLGPVFVLCGAWVFSWLKFTFLIKHALLVSHTLLAISLLIILFSVILGFILAEPHNWSAEEGGFAPFGFSGVLAGTATCLYSFVGFNIITDISEEARNPRRAVPVASATTIGVVAGTYVLVSTMLTLMVPWYSLDPTSAITEGFFQRGYTWAGVIVTAGSVCAMTTVQIHRLFFLVCIVCAMAVDGLFFQVPVMGILVFWILTALLALLMDLKALVQFHSIGTLLAYTFVAASIIVLRFRKASPPSSPGPASPGPLSEEHSSVSDHMQPVGPEQASSPEPGQLRPAPRRYLGFLSGYSPGRVVTWALCTLMASAIILGCVLTFGDSGLPRWGYILLLLLSSAGFLLSLLLLGALQQQPRQDIFQIPLVPLLPALSILLNICLMLQLSYMTWVSFTIWLLIGLGVYFGYGIRHSKENQRESPELTLTCYVVVPSGSPEDTVQTVQPSSQGPTPTPSHME